MNRKSLFIFILHFHQPTGQYLSVLDRIQRNSYEMLLNLLEKQRDQKLTLHFSGPLLMYWKRKYPSFLERLRELVKASRFEVLGGTYSESPLPLLPLEDRLEQLKRGKQLVEEVFETRVEGAWLPERVWDPTLPLQLAEAGYRYVVLDDEVGYRSGLSKEEVHRAFLTEYSGRRVGVVFIDATIRYILPWRSHQEVLSYIRSYSSARGEYVLWGSDAEKFGEWWDRTQAEQWLSLFFYYLRTAEDIEVITPSEYLRRFGYAGLAYLGPWSYDKMIEWSGGYFPNFLKKYSESNNMHKRMLYTRSKLERLKAPAEAWEEYYLAQCNDAFWHGLFGGVYIPILRQAVYEHLIRAERIAEEKGEHYLVDRLQVRELDIDMDGRGELIVEAPLASAFIKPSDGGTLFELDIKDEGMEFNLVNTMSRYREPYLGNGGPAPDWYRRVSFREHVWRRGTRLDDWIDNTPFVDISDLALASYVVEHVGGEVVLSRVGRVWFDPASPHRLHVVKSFSMEGDGRVLRVKYRWRNLEKRFAEFSLAVELSLSPKLPYDYEAIPSYEIEGAAERPATERFVSPWARTVTLKSPATRPITVESSKHGEVWASPIYTWTRTEKGLRSHYQGIGVVLNYHVPLDPGESFETEVKVRW
ncbi:MAG: alpha-amylase/4-alpha-glucanotransferase domain-containing protein [Thermofilum sp.]